MRIPNVPRVPAALVALLLSATALGCGGGDNGTNPGNTAGSVFNLPLPPGRSARFTFDHAATHPYHCGVHQQMRGTVNITATATAESVVVTVNSTTAGFNPDPVTIAVGGYVRWVNVGSLDHSIVND